MKKLSLSLLMTLFISFSVSGQANISASSSAGPDPGPDPTALWRKTFTSGEHHNHFSIVKIEDDIIVAGTTFGTGTNVQIMRLNSAGTIIWEQEYDLGSDERCFDIALGPGNQLALTGYGVLSAGVPHTFVMLVDAGGGAIVDYREFELLGSYDQSTGLDILYSHETEAYYIAGYQSNDILSTSTGKAGYLLSLDGTLTVNWMQQISSPATASNLNMANNLTEIPGTGIFVTGSVNHNPVGFSFVSTLRLMFDYGGSVIWDLTSRSSNNIECGVDAVYDANEDALYVMSNNSVAHTFDIHRIDNASSSGAFVAAAGANDMLATIFVDVAGFSIALDPTEGDEVRLLVAGMTKETYINGNAVDYAPSFIASVDAGTFDVNWFRYIEANNMGYRNHDHDIFQAFLGQQALINYPDILEVTPSNFYILGYTGVNNAYSLSITKTDVNGHTSAEDCEVSTSTTVLNSGRVFTGADVSSEDANDIVVSSSEDATTHTVTDGCIPLEGFFAEKRGVNISQSGMISDTYHVYPNPASTVLQVKMPHTGEAMEVDARMIDAMGRVVMEHTGVYAPGATARFDVEALPDGVYFLLVQSGSYKLQKPVVIAH